MVELGLSSRDAVAMASDIEDLHRGDADGHRGVPASDHRVAGDGHRRRASPKSRLSDDDTDWSRDATSVDDIAIVGIATRFPGDMNTPDETWQALLEGRDAITDLPEGRWEEFLSEPRIAERVAKARTRGGYLSDIKGFDAEFFALSKMEADNIDPQQRMALELTWEALEHARIPASILRGEASASTSAVRPTTTSSWAWRTRCRASVRDHGHCQFDHRQPGVVLLRLPWPVDVHRHRMLELAGRRPPGREGAAFRRCGRRRSSAGSTP